MAGKNSCTIQNLKSAVPVTRMSFPAEILLFPSRAFRLTHTLFRTYPNQPWVARSMNHSDIWMKGVLLEDRELYALQNLLSRAPAPRIGHEGF